MKMFHRLNIFFNKTQNVAKVIFWAGKTKLSDI